MPTDGVNQEAESEQIRKLKLQVAQRDNEINILVSMLKRREGGKGGPGLAMSQSMAVAAGGTGGAMAGMTTSSAVMSSSMMTSSPSVTSSLAVSSDFGVPAGQGGGSGGSGGGKGARNESGACRNGQRFDVEPTRGWYKLAGFRFQTQPLQS